MKLKKLLVVLVISVIGLLSLVDVKADTVLFKARGQQSVSGVTVVPFTVGSSSIRVHLEPYGYVTTYLNGNRIDVPLVKHEVKCPRHDAFNYDPNCYNREWYTRGDRADGGGNYTVQLEKPLTEEDIVTLSFADDGNFYFGKLVYESEKKQAEHFQKEQEVKEKEYAEGLFKRSIEEENNKAWRDVVRDSFQDTWWNLKSWWKG